MTATVAELGERALRRLGVAVVAVANRPALSAVITADAIATDALVALSVIASDETPSPLDQALALGKVLRIHDSLVGGGVASWDLDHIPQAVAEDYELLTALHIAPSFGKTADPAQQPVIEARIRRFSLVQNAPALAVEAVMAVHTDLAARNKVRWTVFDIPAAAEMPYVMLAANRLAPLFSVKPEPMDEMTANRALSQIISLPSSGDRVRTEYF